MVERQTAFPQTIRTLRPRSGRSIPELPAAAGWRPIVEASINPPGGYVTLRAEQDLLPVVTACSVDCYPTNGGVRTGIEVEITSGS